jgi:hypothetical protein
MCPASWATQGHSPQVRVVAAGVVGILAYVAASDPAGWRLGRRRAGTAGGLE